MFDPDDLEFGAGEDLVVLIPVFNDWVALRLLLDELDGVLGAVGLRADVLVVDDGSTVAAGPGFPGIALKNMGSVRVLGLRRNLGHQRAIAVGLAFLGANVPCEAVVVMDGDGEDDPRDVPRLIERCRRGEWSKIVFAERTKRSESWSFRAGYAAYRLLHRILTGQKVRVGNFSVVPRDRLNSLVVVSELWNHYAAAALASRQPFETVPTRRGKRLDGKSSMNFIRLVCHGLSAISVFGDVVGVRLLVALFGLSTASVLGMGATLAVRLLTTLAIPGWTTTVLGVLSVLLFQAIMFAFILSFMILGDRHGLTFLPLRDYAHFVGAVRTVHPNRGRSAAQRAPAA